MWHRVGGANNAERMKSANEVNAERMKSFNTVFKSVIDAISEMKNNE